LNKNVELFCNVPDPEGLSIVKTSSKYSFANSVSEPLVRVKVNMSLFGGEINPLHLAENVPAAVQV